MDKKVFPIKNSAACVYKWSWNTFSMQTGTTSSCHRVKPVYVSPEDFDSFHNTPEVINDRKMMIQGDWPIDRGCEYCKQFEDVGQTSDRTYHNNIPGLVPVEFEDQDNPLVVTPRISEIYIDNTCDLACIYCRPEYSSRLNEEIKKYGEYPVGLKYMPTGKTDYFDLYIDWFEKNYKKLHSISILGGEPFLQKRFWDILDRLEQLEESNIGLQITTNLNCKLDVLIKFLDKCYNLLKHKKIKKVIISCSLDCWGDQAEFIRYGLNLSRWQENFELLIKKKWLHIEVHHVVTALSIKTSLDLQTKISEYKKINPKIIQSYHLVDTENEKIMSPMMFDSLFFSKQLNQLLETFPITQEWDNVSKMRLAAIVKLCSNSSHDQYQLVNFKKTLDQLDYRRKTNWKTLYPEINAYLIEHGL